MSAKIESEKIVELRLHPERMEQFLRCNETKILRYASSAVKRYVCKQDDEWSVALTAFAEAIEHFETDKGSFDTFAKLVIKRRLIDYERNVHKRNAEISVDPSVFDFDGEQDNPELLAVQQQMPYDTLHTTDCSAAEEIAMIAETLSEYGFTFFDLTTCSPKSQKTKEACARAAVELIRSPDLVTEMRRTKMMPIKILQKNLDLPRKLLERHRKYIITVTEILLGDYPTLSEYLYFIAKELNR